MLDNAFRFPNMTIHFHLHSKTLLFCLLESYNGVFTLQWEFFTVQKGVTTSANKLGLSNPISLPILTVSKILPKMFKKLNLKKFTKCEVFNFCMT